jgi:hypothetical protein
MLFQSNMLSSTVVIGAIIAISFCACKKDKDKHNPHSPTDAQKIRLKEVAVQGLPSPYFNYSYDADNFITSLGHESGHYQYKIEYKNGRVNRMINNTLINKDTLMYHYTGQQVTRIDILEPGKGKIEETALFYDNDNKLTEVTWRKVTAASIFKRLIFHYNEHKNMSRCEVYYDLGVTGMQKTNTYIYEGFDDKVNLTSNYVLKELHYLFLPALQLQHNNPISYRLLGVDNDLEFSNTYQYSDSLPVLKTTLIKQTRGTGAGMERIGRTWYSYY